MSEKLIDGSVRDIKLERISSTRNTTILGISLYKEK